MEILLEELYITDLHMEKFHPRKVSLEASKSYFIQGITQSGKTKLIKHHLLQYKKSEYLYIDCSDTRIDVDELNKVLFTFCTKNKIKTLALDNYNPDLKIVNVSQIIIASQERSPYDFLENITLYPLDYEEFLAYEHKYDSSALNHFFKLGALAVMHKIPNDERNLFIQRVLLAALVSIEYEILSYCAKYLAQKISAYTIYERLKMSKKISKDKLYLAFESLKDKNYIHLLEKFAHPKAVKKIYLCDIIVKSALSIEKNFAKLFENMIYLELLKSKQEAFYDEGIDFYLPSHSEIIFSIPFTDERTLFKKIEMVEAFIITHQIKKITAVTMNKEAKLIHPFSKVEMIPFDIWALGD